MLLRDEPEGPRPLGISPERDPAPLDVDHAACLGAPRRAGDEEGDGHLELSSPHAGHSSLLIAES